MSGKGIDPKDSHAAAGAAAEGGGSLLSHGRFDVLNEPAQTRMARYFEQFELLNRLQPVEVRLRQVARNYLDMTKVHARQ